MSDFRTKYTRALIFRISAQAPRNQLAAEVAQHFGSYKAPETVRRTKNEKNKP
jgi:hypothetical protein